MADQTELRMNLVAIKRVDPYAKDIVNTSAHVAFYVFNNAENEWEKTDIEGALFIYSRYAEPYHSIFINNRLNTNSLVEPIRGQIEVQSKPPFLLYRNERSRIRSFWFYNNAECDRIGEVIQRLVTECGDGGGGGGGVGVGVGELRPSVNGGGPVPSSGIFPSAQGIPNGGPNVTEGDGSNNVDIFSMLTKAQEDFQNNSTVPPNGGVGVVIGKPMEHPVVMGHHAAMLSGGPAVPVPQQQPPPQQQISNQNAPRSVVNFFAAAKQPAASEVPLFKTLAPVHTLEQIEKQHRATTPQKDTPGKVTPDVAELESNFKRMGIPIVGNGNGGPQTPSGGMPELGTSPLATFLSAANLSRANHHQPVVVPKKLIEISELESRQNVVQQQQQTPLHELLKKSDATVVKPALMPPTMFKPTASNTTPTGPGVVSSSGNVVVVATSAGKNKSNAKQQQQQQQQHHQQQQRDANSGVTPPKGASTAVTSLPGTMANIVAIASNKTSNNSNLINNNTVSNSSNGGVEPLTQNQLIQAVSYLIKHDPDFVRKLHEAYVKSFTEMISN